MATLPCCPSAAHAAHQILRLLRSDHQERLGEALQRIGEAGRRRASEPGPGGERWELLRAIADGMRAGPEPQRAVRVEVCVRLLEHLAGERDPAGPAAGFRSKRLRPPARSIPPPGRPSCSRP